MKRWLGALPLAAALALPAACSSTDASSASIVFTIYGEDVARSGFAFPPVDDGPAFVDGWEVRYERLLLTVDHLTLSEDPDVSPTDQSQVGPVVAQADGPWAVDLTKAGAAVPAMPARSVGLRREVIPTTGRGSVEDRSVRLVKLESLNRSSGKALDPSVRYAFGYAIVPAADSARPVNFDSADPDYAEMIRRGWTMLLVGTATFKGTACASSIPAYDFTKLPKSVRFRFGFTAPTRYVNCQNTDLTGQPFGGEEAQRGVQVKSGETTYVQLTLHTDHVFWNTVDHEAAAPTFDQMAALSKGGILSLDDLAGVDFTAFRGPTGAPLPWRSCIPEVAVKDGERRFDPGSVSVDPTGTPERALRDYRDFVTYVTSTAGHMNADGLCAIDRQYASPR